MEHVIYVFIQEDSVKCYPNLRQLANNHPQVPYYSISKLLRKSAAVKRKTYTIAVTKMKWKTKRRFPSNEAM